MKCTGRLCRSGPPFIIRFPWTLERLKQAIRAWINQGRPIACGHCHLTSCICPDDLADCECWRCKAAHDRMYRLHGRD